MNRRAAELNEVRRAAQRRLARPDLDGWEEAEARAALLGAEDELDEIYRADPIAQIEAQLPTELGRDRTRTTNLPPVATPWHPYPTHEEN